MQVLVTNDDGVNAPGIRHLAEAIGAVGHEVTVFAPSSEWSGASAAVGSGSPGDKLQPLPISWAGSALDGHVYTLNGPPGLCVSAAQLGAFRPMIPDVVVSGINTTWNPGWQILHSGTVGAALTAANFGGRGISVSLNASPDLSNTHWETAASLAVRAIESIATANRGTVVSVNVPNLSLSELSGVKRAKLTPSTTLVLDLEDGPASPFAFRRDYEVELDPESDVRLLQAGYATVTPLCLPHFDVSDHATAVTQSFLDNFL